MTNCRFCENEAIAYTKSGHLACSRHKHEKIEINDTCPICKDELQTKKGKYGAYFFCWGCGRNWNYQSIERFNQI